MTLKRQKQIWPWVLISVLATVVVAFLVSFVLRLVSPPVSALANDDDPRSVIQVEVVNGSGVKGAGRIALEFLRKRGFDVVEISTTSELSRRSIVVDRLGDKLSARKVASTMGIADSLVSTDIDSMRFLRATVLLGTDIGKLEPFHD